MPGISGRLLTKPTAPAALIPFVAAARTVAAFPSKCHDSTCDAVPTLTSLTSRRRSSSRGFARWPRGVDFFLRSSRLSGLPTLIVLNAAIEARPTIDPLRLADASAGVFAIKHRSAIFVQLDPQLGLGYVLNPASSPWASPSSGGAKLTVRSSSFWGSQCHSLGRIRRLISWFRSKWTGAPRLNRALLVLGIVVLIPILAVLALVGLAFEVTVRVDTKDRLKTGGRWLVSGSTVAVGILILI